MTKSNSDTGLRVGGTVMLFTIIVAILTLLVAGRPEDDTAVGALAAAAVLNFIGLAWLFTLNSTLKDKVGKLLMKRRFKKIFGLEPPDNPKLKEVYSSHIVVPILTLYAQHLKLTNETLCSFVLIEGIRREPELPLSKKESDSVMKKLKRQKRALERRWIAAVKTAAHFECISRDNTNFREFLRNFEDSHS